VSGIRPIGAVQVAPGHFFFNQCKSGLQFPMLRARALFVQSHVVFVYPSSSVGAIFLVLPLRPVTHTLRVVVFSVAPPAPSQALHRLIFIFSRPHDVAQPERTDVES
jgi:hypothetical protein